MSCQIFFFKLRAKSLRNSRKEKDLGREEKKKKKTAASIFRDGGGKIASCLDASEIGIRLRLRGHFLLSSSCLVRCQPFLSLQRHGRLHIAGPVVVFVYLVE